MKMPTIVRMFIFISRENIILGWVEHEKSFITSKPHICGQGHHGLYCVCVYVCVFFFFFFFCLFFCFGFRLSCTICFVLLSFLVVYVLLWCFTDKEHETSRNEHIQSNFNISNTDGSFTMANLNSFSSPFEILLIAQEKKYLKKIVLFYHEIVC